MEESFYVEYVRRFFTKVSEGVINKLNGTDNPITYLHRRMLQKKFSLTGEWKSMTSSNVVVMADIVSMDSSLPLKTRPSIAHASGLIPKMGMELYLNETQLTELDTMIALRMAELDIVAEMFEDTARVLSGVYERNEDVFLQGLSSGIALVDDDQNVGAGVRVNYGYPAANIFSAAADEWNVAATAKPIDDLKRMQKAANSRIIRFMMDDITFGHFASSTQVIQQFAFSLNFVGNVSGVPTPDLNQVNTMLKSKTGIGAPIEIVDRTTIFEKDGVQTTKTPWTSGAVVGICSEKVGSLIYAQLAEKAHKALGVAYLTVDDFILLSKYATNRPKLTEWTSSQARVLPVISNVQNIFLLNTLELEG